MRGEGWHEQRREMQYPEEKNLRGWRGVSVKEILRFFEGEDTEEVEGAPDQNKETVKSLFDGFLTDLRARGIRVSTPEWMHFLTVVKERMKDEQLRNATSAQEIFERLRVYARVTLVKNKQDESTFNEAFDQYFLNTAKVVENAVLEEEKKEDATLEEQTESSEPDMKEQLGITEVDENLDLPEDGEHDDNEEVHGGKKDQHNDILRKEDMSKKGGGDKKDSEDGGEGDKGKESKGKGNKGDEGQGEGEKGEAGKGKGDKGEEGSGAGDKGEAGKGQGDKGDAGAGKGDKGKPSGMGKGGKPGEAGAETGGENDRPGSQEMEEFQETGILKGGGKGSSREAVRVAVASAEGLTRQHAQERAERVLEHDRKSKYERRPERADIRQIIRNLRRIILDTSQVRSGKVDLRGTVERFARRDFRIDYKREREKQPEIVLFIDVGGPVDEWSPLIREVAEEMTKGLTKLEIYLFHNNLYGYVWEFDPKNPENSNYAKPNSLIDVKSVVKRNKKVIVYGDAEMSATEFEQDNWPPRDNEEGVRKFGMSGSDCLRWIEHRADSAVWVNPIFKKEWDERDGSGTIASAKEIVPMHDLSVGGVQDAIKELMKR
ncbi:hypothetical protein EPN81_03145 [Patescibacteria group bacterium]|nr:MAG: hypothetical protein EPN81_03145 [Patescibacteria group bacterium]